MRACPLTTLLAQGESVPPIDSRINPSHHLYQAALQDSYGAVCYAIVHDCRTDGSTLAAQWGPNAAISMAERKLRTKVWSRRCRYEPANGFKDSARTAQ